MSTLVVKLVSAEPLPSQAGMRGRPREHGRASITGIAGMKPALVQRALAESLGCRSSALVPYARETQPGERLTFVVPDLDRDTRVIYTAEMVEDSELAAHGHHAPPHEDAPVEHHLVGGGNVSSDEPATDGSEGSVNPFETSF